MRPFIVALLTGCTTEIGLVAPLVDVEPPPSHVDCGPDAPVLEARLVDFGEDWAEYAPRWRDTNYWWICPRPTIDLGTAWCPTNLDGVARSHEVVCEP